MGFEKKNSYTDFLIAYFLLSDYHKIYLSKDLWSQLHFIMHYIICGFRHQATI